MKNDNTISFEDALNELELISDKIENGNFTLDQLVDAYKRGGELYKICNSKLKTAKLEIEKIHKDKNNIK